MVCSVGSGKMAVMARLLAGVSFSKGIAEEVRSKKLAAQYVQLCEADEANLLDEEDMHVFDLMPLADPLLLVSCNACKKPIKMSQYAAHAELCKSLRIAEEMGLELNGGTGHKKPPRKKGKKLVAAYASTPGEGKNRFVSAKADIERTSSSVNGVSTIDGLRVAPANLDYSTDAIPPPTKRSKLISAEAVHKSDQLNTTNDVVQSSSINNQEAHTCRGFTNWPGGGFKRCFDCVEFREPGHRLSLQRKDIPVPLATKTFYSLRNHRLRSALKYMYCESLLEEHSDNVNLNASQGDETRLQVSLSKNSHEQIGLQMQKVEKQPLLSVRVKKPEQVLEDCSDVYIGKLGNIRPMDFSNQGPVNNDLKSQAASMVNMKSNCISEPFPFAGNSGSRLGTIQQPKGSVHVT